MRVLTAALLPFALAAWAGAAQFTIFHTNDVHGWIMSRPAPAGFGDDPAREIGGLPAVAQVVRREPGPKLLLDAGDWYQGTPEGTLSEGKAVAEGFNAAGYDAVAVGNHEFDLGRKVAESLARSLKMPVLAANIYVAGTNERPTWVRPYVIKEVAGAKVGIFGLVTSNMRNLTFERNYEGLSFRREAEEARDAVAALKRQGADVIVALTHVGFENPKKPPFEGEKFLAENAPGIDIIVGGHSHTVLFDPVKAGSTWIVQAGSYLTRVGKLVVDLDEKKRIRDVKGQLIDLWIDKWGQAEDVLQVVKRHQEKVAREMDVVIATSTVALLRNRDGESTLGDWMTDCLRGWAKTDLAFQNSGGIRADLGAGPVTLRDIFQVMPFDNSVVTMTIAGMHVQDILEHGVSGHAGMMQVSGIALRYDAGRPPGRRLKEVEAAGAPLEMGRKYTAATVDFLVQGGDKYGAFAQASNKVYTGTLLRDVLSECARKTSPIRMPAGNRIVRE